MSLPLPDQQPPSPEQIKIEDKLHTVREVAAIFGVDEQTVRIWLRDKKLVGLKVNSNWRVTKQAMQEFAIVKYG